MQNVTPTDRLERTAVNADVTRLTEGETPSVSGTKTCVGERTSRHERGMGTREEDVIEDHESGGDADDGDAVDVVRVGETIKDLKEVCRALTGATLENTKEEGSCTIEEDDCRIRAGGRAAGMHLKSVFLWGRGLICLLCETSKGVCQSAGGALRGFV